MTILHLWQDLILELIVGEELGVDVDVSQQHDPHVLLVDLEELEELRSHMFPVKGLRQQTVFAATTAAGICQYTQDGE